MDVWIYLFFSKPCAFSYAIQCNISLIYCSLPHRLQTDWFFLAGAWSNNRIAWVMKICEEQCRVYNCRYLCAATTDVEMPLYFILIDMCVVLCLYGPAEIHLLSTLPFSHSLSLTALHSSQSSQFHSIISTLSCVLWNYFFRGISHYSCCSSCCCSYW